MSSSGYSKVKVGDGEVEVELSSLVEEKESGGNERNEEKASWNTSCIYYYAVFSTIAFALTFFALIIMLYRADDSSSSSSSECDINTGNYNVSTIPPSHEDVEFTTTTLPPTTTTGNRSSGGSSNDCADHMHLVSNLPGYGTLDTCHYAGKLDADVSQRKMFYWLVEAEGGYENAPLLIWFNGGPMCSSLLGLLSEHGPFVITDNPSHDYAALLENPYSWHKAPANVLYVESPALVGFSTDSSSSHSSDSSFATRTLAFLDHFLESHSRFQSSPVWLSGESYAGHYVTRLATEMISNRDTSTISSNLVGFMIGNAVTDDTFKYDGGSQFRTLYQHDFISDRTYSAVSTNCADSCNPFSSGFTSTCSSCSNALTLAKTEAGLSGGDITVYDLYADVCRGRRRRQLKALIRHRERRNLNIDDDNDDDDDLEMSKNNNNKNNQRRRLQCSNDEEEAARSALNDPCTENHVTTYLRRSDVREALHVSDSNTWSACSNHYYAYTQSVLNLYEDTLLSSNLHILIYSGSVDDSVSTDGTRAWIRYLRETNKLTYASSWSRWTVQNQVAGYLEKYNEGLTFATVRGAGHMVPSSQPERALELVRRFMKDQNLLS